MRDKRKPLSRNMPKGDIDSRSCIASNPNQTIRYFTEDEIRAVLTVLHDAENRLLFLMGLNLGGRVGEVATLAWSRTNFRQKYIVILDEKKDGYRVCQLPDNVWELLKVHAAKVDKRKQDRVFPYSPKTLNRRLKEWAKDAGIDRRVNWHMLRHSYVVHSRRAGRDWKLISQQTGDTLRTLITTYDGLSLEDSQKFIEQQPLLGGIE